MRNRRILTNRLATAAPQARQLAENAATAIATSVAAKRRKAVREIAALLQLNNLITVKIKKLICLLRNQLFYFLERILIECTAYFSLPPARSPNECAATN